MQSVYSTAPADWARTQMKQKSCFYLDGDISSLYGKILKLVDLFEYLGSNISSTESDSNLCIGKAA